MLSVQVRRRSVALIAAAFALSLAACKDDATGADDHDHEPEIEEMRLSIAGQVITVSDNGTVSPAGPIILPVGTSSVSAQFLDHDGQPDDHVTAAEFQLNVLPATGAPVSFTRSTTNPFAGTLTATTAAENVVIRFSLFHIEEQHNDFGPFPVTFSFR
jgi:hypothetical protein